MTWRALLDRCREHMGGHHNRARRYTEIESGDEPKRAPEQAERKGVKREGLALCEEVPREGRSAVLPVLSKNISSDDGGVTSQISIVEPMAGQAVSVRNTRIGRIKANGLPAKPR